jgi:hypothetical protein
VDQATIEMINAIRRCLPLREMLRRRECIEKRGDLSDAQLLDMVEAQLQQMDRTFLFSVELKEGSRRTMLDLQKQAEFSPEALPTSSREQ